MAIAARYLLTSREEKLYLLVFGLVSGAALRSSDSVFNLRPPLFMRVFVHVLKRLRRQFSRVIKSTEFIYIMKITTLCRVEVSESQRLAGRMALQALPFDDLHNVLTPRM